MATYQLKLPITRASEYGFKHIKSVESSIWQDLKCLMLTNPGEKINDPDFGVGLRTYIFEQNSPALLNELRNIISQKINKYMPFINIEDILFTDSDNTLLITINYYIANSPNLDQIVLELNSASE
jgi:phage baseplate assembly protein W